jgi:hypothetical protein
VCSVRLYPQLLVEVCSVRLYPQLLVEVMVSYLCYLYLLPYSGIQHVLTIINKVSGVLYEAGNTHPS